MKISVFLLLGIISCKNSDKNISNKNLSGEKLAIQIAEHKWNEVYGEEKMADEQPLKAKKINDSIWYVHGTLPKGYIGGVAFGKVDVKNKKVIEYSHGE